MVGPMSEKKQGSASAGHPLLNLQSRYLIVKVLIVKSFRLRELAGINKNCERYFPFVSIR